MVVVVLVSFIAFGVQGNRAKIPATADTANATSASGVKVGNQQAPVLVELYEDFQCPICNNLEQSGLTKDFDAKIKATTIKVNYHVMSFLDSSVEREQVLLAGGQRRLLRGGPERGRVPEVPRHPVRQERRRAEQPAGRG